MSRSMSSLTIYKAIGEGWADFFVHSHLIQTVTNTITPIIRIISMEHITVSTAVDVTYGELSESLSRAALLPVDMVVEAPMLTSEECTNVVSANSVTLK